MKALLLKACTLSLILSTSTLFAQSNFQIAPTLSHKHKWLINNHVQSHIYSMRSDKIYYSNFDIFSNWYGGVQVKKNNFVGYVGYGREYYASSTGINPPNKNEISIREVPETAETHTLDFTIGYAIAKPLIMNRTLEITPYIGYSLAFVEAEFLSFEGLYTQSDETSGELLFSYFLYDQPGVHSSIGDRYHFAQVGLDLNYYILKRLALIIGGGYTYGFNTVGLGEIDLYVPNDPVVYKSITKTHGSSINFKLGLSYLIDL